MFTKLSIQTRLAALCSAAICALTVGVAHSQTAEQKPAQVKPEEVKQTTYASAEDAVKALKEAAGKKDREALQRIFGPKLKELCSGDDVQDTGDFERFAGRLEQRQRLVAKGENGMVLEIGADGYPFPIPLVRKDGKWFFDTEEGIEEMLNRRVGSNELGAIRVCRGYVVAQFEYFSQDRDGDNVLEYAQKFTSAPGQRDGLYWETKLDEPASPLGPAIAAARAEGYEHGKDAAAGDQRQPYHGYIYRIITKQGGQSPGGAFNYVINGNMVAGFALVAYPVDWQNSGVMTFMVNSNGKVYQKDLGEKTLELAGKIESYDIDSSWSVVED
jgi:hypothetical protein